MHRIAIIRFDDSTCTSAPFTIPPITRERVLVSEQPANYSLYTPPVRMTRWLQHCSLHLPSQERVLVSEWPANYSLYTPPVTRESACVRMTRWLQHCSLHLPSQERVLVLERTAWQQHHSLHLQRECLRQNKQPDNSIIHYTSHHKRECLHQNNQPDNSTVHYTSQESACIRTNSLTTALFTTPPKRVLVSERTAWQEHYSLHLPPPHRDQCPSFNQPVLHDDLNRCGVNVSTPLARVGSLQPGWRPTATVWKHRYVKTSAFTCVL